MTDRDQDNDYAASADDYVRAFVRWGCLVAVICTGLLMAQGWQP